MNRPPPFSSHSSRESNQRFISATVIFRFTFFWKLLRCPRIRATQWKSFFHHEKKPPVSLLAGARPGRRPRHPQFWLRQKGRRQSNPAGGTKPRRCLGGKNQLHRSHVAARSGRQFLPVSRHRAMARRPRHESRRLAADVRRHARPQAGQRRQRQQGVRHRHPPHQGQRH